MLFGTAVHAEVEHRLLTGKWNPATNVNARALSVARTNEHVLPDAPVEKKWVEASLRIDKGTNGIELPVVGYIDWVEPFANRVSDHKTQSDSRWSLTEAALSRDPQSIIYTKFALLRYPTVFKENHVNFRHIYYPTTSRSRADFTEVRLSIRDIEEGFNHLATQTSLMVQDAKHGQAKQVQPNLAACGDYGGCPFRSYCQTIGDLNDLDPFAMFSSNKDKGEKRMSLFDKIKSGKAKETEAVAIAEGINPPRAPKPEVVETVLSEAEKTVLVIKSLSKHNLAGFKLIPVKAQGWIMREVDKGKDIVEVMESAITKLAKVEKNKDLVSQISIARGKTKKPKKKTKTETDQELLDLARGDGWEDLAKAQTGPAAAPEKKFNKNNSQNPLENFTVGDYIKGQEANDVVEVDDTPMNTQPTKVFKDKPANWPRKEGAYSYLFVDCMPRFAKIDHFDEWIKPLVEQVLTQHRARHYMLSPLDFGKGKAEIQCALSTWLRTEGNRLPLKMHVSKRHPLAEIFLSETAGSWHEVVEG